jgi:tRNA (guanine-N7-)-methyltransferase
MRMRRKRNLEPRMQACADVLIARGRPCLNLKEAAERYRNTVDYSELFGNGNPVELEVGCGNGGFIAELAKRNPAVNYLAAEMCDNVALTAMERIKGEGIPNVRFLNVPAEILECSLPANSVRKIYLNFSTPLPEKNREKQRLTAPRFLAIYFRLLVSGGEIVQKTDSEQFFDYSLEQFAQNGYAVKDVTRDLHRSAYVSENIVTEYERKFLAQGLPIFRAVAVKTE